MSIVSDVKKRGFDAVRDWALELDGVEPRRAEPDAAGLPRDAILALADRVRRWHAAQRPADVALEVEPGVLLERRWVPLDTVGVYVPRNLISTLVMCVVPAQVAGVRRIVVCTPPEGAGTIAAAAELLGVDEVWALGGPQAIGYLAYVERVDKIAGPGNAYVNEAKLEVARDVAIDLPGGPSEVVVLGGGDSPLVALELAAQREHGHEAVCTTVETLAEAEAIAPEHLVLLGDAEAYADRVRNAGSVFVGPYSPVPAGDYATGGNHVLPTNGWARSVGGLG
ncbi:MAG: histidinol dehydrogenase, partial [Gaiellaceae bacterium]